MNRTFARERVRPASEWTHQPALHRPQAGPDVGLPLFGVGSEELRYGSRLKKVVLAQRLAEVGRKRRTVRNIGGSLGLAFQPIGHRNFAGEYLQRRQLLVFLVSNLL